MEKKEFPLYLLLLKIQTAGKNKNNYHVNVHHSSFFCAIPTSKLNMAEKKLSCQRSGKNLSRQRSGKKPIMSTFTTLLFSALSRLWASRGCSRI
jgi:hypothetical protein